jgi:2-polyprenyl-3-methyl-5-hydroxy-6-metoxy-1,4-benzoquinol methylase
MKAKTPDGLYDVGEEDLRVYREQYLPHRLCTYARFLPQLERFRESGRLLEIGAGYGYFLKLANDAGWDSEGVEISPYCCQVARQQGCAIRQGSLDDFEFVNGHYDVVVLWDVIEHFAEPDQIIGRCWELLRSGGGLMMRTPDARGLTPGLQPLRAAYRHLAYPANTPEHVFHFTPGDLSAMAANHGFKVSALDCAPHWDERVISANHEVVRVARWLLMRAAQRRTWPYEFVLTAVKA